MVPVKVRFLPYWWEIRLLRVTKGSVTFYGKNLLELSPEDRSHEGIFLSFQYPVEIPGVSMVNFMRAAVNEQRKYKGLPALTASEFLKLMREKCGGRAG